jgi:hypothetical protein
MKKGEGGSSRGESKNEADEEVVDDWEKAYEEE